MKLSQEIAWDKMAIAFQNLYSEQGRPSIPIRKIAGLLLLKEMFKESDESVVERWIENGNPLKSKEILQNQRKLFKIKGGCSTIKGIPLKSKEVV